jgi:hypothetical protein
MLMTTVGDLGDVFLFIVLQPVEGSPVRYRRIGIAKHDEIVRFDIASMDVRNITII